MKPLLATLLVLMFNRCATPEADYLVYVGTYTGKGSEGLYAYRFNSVNGDLTPIGLVSKTENPSYLVVDKKGQFLYAVNETDLFEGEHTGAISVFTINRESGALTLLQQIPSLGTAPCHLSFDRTGNYLMVANYNEGTAAVFPIGTDGRLNTRTAFVRNAGSSVHPDRQNRSHTHSIQPTPNNQFVVIADLGTDKLLTYRFDTLSGSLDPLDSGVVNMNPGSGPRHVTFSPTGKFAYVINELTSTVTVFSLDTDIGSMRQKQTVSILPDTFSGANTAAEITIDANGKFMYVSNRGHDSIGIFSIAPDDGSLNSMEWVSSGGKTPRHFEIDPTGKWLLVANQNSNNLILFEIDQNTGRLVPKEQTQQVSSPVCVRFVPIR